LHPLFDCALLFAASGCNDGLDSKPADDEPIEDVTTVSFPPACAKPLPRWLQVWQECRRESTVATHSAAILAAAPSPCLARIKNSLTFMFDFLQKQVEQ